MSLEELKKFVELEYQALCQVTGLTAVPLDIWFCVDDCLEKTVEGNCFAQSTPYYGVSKASGKKIIALPVLDGDLGSYSQAVTFPPVGWDRHSAEWPTWRIELWHEVVHQVQDELLGRWDPKDPTQGHTTGWNEAIVAVAGKLNVDSSDIENVVQDKLTTNQLWHTYLNRK